MTAQYRVIHETTKQWTAFMSSLTAVRTLIIQPSSIWNIVIKPYFRVQKGTLQPEGHFDFCLMAGSNDDADVKLKQEADGLMIEMSRMSKTIVRKGLGAYRHSNRSISETCF